MFSCRYMCQVTYLCILVRTSKGKILPVGRGSSCHLFPFFQSRYMRDLYAGILDFLVPCSELKFGREVVAWKQLQPTGTSPSTRCQHSAIYNPESHSMLIFGGDKGPTPQIADCCGVDSRSALSAPQRQPRPRQIQCWPQES